MPQLTEAIEAEAEIIVTESVCAAKLLLGRHSDFQFVLGAGICYDLPVVVTVHKGPITD